MPKAPEPFSTCQKTTKSLPRISPKSYCYNAVPNRFLAHFSTSRTNGPRLLSRAKAGTHSPSPTGSHTAAYTAKQGRFRWGRYYYPRTVSHVSETLRGQGVERQTLPLLGLGWGVLPKNAESLGTAMRSCASLFRRRRGPAGLRDLFRFCQNCDLYAMRTCARHGRYHYPRRALRAVETPDGRLSKRLTCRFLRSGGRSSPHDSYFLANTQNFLLAVPVANAFALWYDKFKELEEFQNNYAVKFPFAIASSSPGPRPEQQKGSAIP